MQPKRSSPPPAHPPWERNQLVVFDEAVDEVRRILDDNRIGTELAQEVGRYRVLLLQPREDLEGEDAVEEALDLLKNLGDEDRPIAEPNHIHGCPQMRGGQFVLPDPVPPPEVVFQPSEVGAGVQVLVLDTIYVAPPSLRSFVQSVGNDASITVNGELAPSGGHASFVVGQILRVAPGTTIDPVTLLDNNGECNDTQLAQALIDARPQQPNIVNLSLGCQTYNDQLPNVLQAPIDDLADDGAVIVAAAGNDDSTTKWFPAAYGLQQPAVYGIGAVVCVYKGWWRAAYSNYGDWVRAVARGELEGPFPEWRIQPQPYDGWARWSGTSFSTPLVTGAIAAQLSADPGVGARGAADELLRQSPAWWKGEIPEPPPDPADPNQRGDFGAAPVINPPMRWP